MQTQCLVRGGAETVIAVRVRFLRLVRRETALDEAAEEEVASPDLRLAALASDPVQLAIALAPKLDVSCIPNALGAVIRAGAALEGTIGIAAEPAGAGLYRLTVRIENTTPAAGASRDSVQHLAFASTHTVLGVQHGAFVSLTDPPDELRTAAASCRNDGTWPVLVGDDGDTDTLLSSPIILPDYPQIAPESPGDLFDGSEIDEILTLRILTMTDEEKREAAADPRARALLERTEALTPSELEALHGTWRKPRLASIMLAGRNVALGDHVRLRPKRRADIMDTVLDGMLAIVEGIERDFEDRVHLAVTIADDPGRDFGTDRYPGHRFFFALDEVEPP
jgi:hypothetical protein